MDERERIKKIISQAHITHTVLRSTDIPDQVKEIAESCKVMDPNLDTTMCFAFAMTVLSHLLLNNRIILKKEIKQEEKDV